MADNRASAKSDEHLTPLSADNTKTEEAVTCPCKCEQDNNKDKSKKTEVNLGVPAAVALNWMINGNSRYQKGNIRTDGQNQKSREKLILSQKPHTIVFSCSDSRVPPEVIFDQKLGEIFVVRTAGEAVDSMAIASIEYAIEHLGSHLLIVLGHESCGAVKAAHSTFGGKDAGSAALNALVKDIQPRIKKFEGSKPSNSFVTEVKANALGVANDLIGRSNIISKKVEDKELRIETAIYHLNSGWVEFYSESPQIDLAKKNEQHINRMPASEEEKDPHAAHHE
jgi:carbonic anhydrase